MTDPRCNCGDVECAICSAPEFRPWTPKPGEPFPAEMARAAAEEEGRKIEAFEFARTLRRYLLVLLLTSLGSMIGSAITILTFIHLE